MQKKFTRYSTMQSFVGDLLAEGGVVRGSAGLLLWYDEPETIADIIAEAASGETPGGLSLTPWAWTNRAKGIWVQDFCGLSYSITRMLEPAGTRYRASVNGQVIGFREAIEEAEQLCTNHLLRVGGARFIAL